MAKQWRCAVVGTSTVGQTHVKVIGQIPHAKLVAVCDLIPERAQAALAKNGVNGVAVYKDQAEMLEKEQIDVVHIATPSGLHLGPAMVAIEHGKNVICEKPLEIQIDRIDQMIAAAAKHKVRLACVYQNRWNEANRAIKQAAAEGRFGTVAWAGCFTPWYRPDKYYEELGWRGTWKMDGGGAIMNQSIHSIDLLQWIAGPVKTVTAFASSRIHKEIETEDTLSCALEFESGAFGTIMGSTAMFPGSPARIEIGGENGTAVSEDGLKVFSFREEQPGDQAIRDRLAPQPEAPPDPSAGKGDLHTKLIADVLNAWDEVREAETSGAEARKAVAIILAMYESVRSGGSPVRVK